MGDLWALKGLIDGGLLLFFLYTDLQLHLLAACHILHSTAKLSFYLNFVVEGREWSTWVDTTKASWASSFSPLWSHYYIWRALCNHISTLETLFILGFKFLIASASLSFPLKLWWCTILFHFETFFFWWSISVTSACYLCSCYCLEGMELVVGLAAMIFIIMTVLSWIEVSAAHNFLLDHFRFLGCQHWCSIIFQILKLNNLLYSSDFAWLPLIKWFI